jgi:hypothetical protein
MAIPACTALDSEQDKCFWADLGNATSPPVFISPGGLAIVQLWQAYPALSPFYLDIEKTFNPTAWVHFAEANVWLALLLCAVYCVAIEWGRSVMRSREPFDLRGVLFWWNAMLAAFSIIGAVRTVPHLLHNLFVHGFEYAICAAAEESYGCGATGMWTAMFIFSKVPELGDTLFLVLRKKPVIFLHWYHHVSVLLYSWWSYATRSSAGLWFISVNFTTHAVMYSYYALQARGYRNENFARAVTTLQLTQMVLGAFVCATVPILSYSGVDCSMTSESYWGGIAIFASYFYLFLILALARYCSSGTRDSGTAKAPRAVKNAQEADSRSLPEPESDPDMSPRRRKTRQRRTDQ